MAEFFTIVKGKHPTTGEDVDPSLSTKQVDQWDQLFKTPLIVDTVYKNQRHVTRVSCVRGVSPYNTDYAKTLSFCDEKEPMVNYIDTATKEHHRCAAAEFIEWMGLEWSAEEAEESEETKAHNANFEAYGKRLTEAAKDVYKEPPPSDKIKRPRGRPARKSRRSSEK